MHDIQVQGNRLNLGKRIGEGCTSQVYKATNKKGQCLCIKVINNTFYNTSTGKELIDNEIQILSKLSHQSILTFYKTYHKDKVMIITELCQEGTLYDYLKKKKKIEEKQCNQIMRCIIEGCCYLHDKGILHRDLKPQNIFRKNKKVKIADFGFAVQIGNNKLLNLNVGSPLYMPYEALSQNKFGIQSDIFAIGVIWYELLTGNTPFSAATQQELRQKTKNNQFRTKEIKCNKKIQKTIFKCLTKTISERPKIKDLLQVIKETTQIQRLRTQSLVVSANIPKQISISETKDEKNKQNKHQKNQSKENCLIVAANKQNRSFTNCNKENKFKYFKYLPKITQVKNKDKANIYPLTIKIKQSLQLKTKHQGPQDFIKILGRLAQLNLGFLPYSIQAKFLAIINKYSNLLLTSKDEPIPTLQRFSQFKDDDLIAEINKCQSQSTLCKCLYNFMRRLMRIAKSYKEWSGKLKDLNLLWERVQRICKMEVPSS